MAKRFVSICFRNLKTDWLIRHQPGLKQLPFALVIADHGRMIVTAVNALAQKLGVGTGMVLADARAIIPSLQVFDDEQERAAKLLKGLAEWFIRYTPAVAIDLPDGLLLDVTGCAHLWGGEKQYLTEMSKRLQFLGYHIGAAMADTIGTAWAVARFGNDSSVIECGRQAEALLLLPPAALRLDGEIIERLEKLGLRQIINFINMPPASLRRRFGQQLLRRLNEALGREEEAMNLFEPVHLYEERLHCLEPIVTATGIEIALERLLDIICHRLQSEQKGLRAALFKGYRVDGKIEKIKIGTNRASCNKKHLFKLFEIKLSAIEPALGIELFILEAPIVEDLAPVQEKLWKKAAGLDDIGLTELLDRLAGKIGSNQIHRYVPAEHYWPEHSFRKALTLHEPLQTIWKTDRPRPLQLFSKPEPIEVTAPVPDYPPMLFRYKGKLHKITRSDGPERIEPEWWLQEGQHRDYYYVEDEEGHRYWLFRSGHYDAAKSYQWFIHGLFP